MGDLDLTKFQAIGQSSTFVVPEAMKLKVDSDIMSMNLLIDDSRGLVPGLPTMVLTKSRIRHYDGTWDGGSYDFTRIKKNPDTPTGKKPKYPFSVFAVCGSNRYSDSVLADIDYLPNWEIGKVRISIRESLPAFHIYAAIVSGKLSITKIESSNVSGERIILFRTVT